MPRSFRHEKTVSFETKQNICDNTPEPRVAAQGAIDPKNQANPGADSSNSSPGDTRQIVSAEEADIQLQSNPLGIPSVYEDEQERIKSMEKTESTESNQEEPPEGVVAEGAQVKEQVEAGAKEVTEADIKDALEIDKKRGVSKSDSKSTKSSTKNK